MRRGRRHSVLKKGIHFLLFLLTLWAISALLGEGVSLLFRIPAGFLLFEFWTRLLLNGRLLPKPDLSKMSGVEFEHYCADLLERDGFRHVTVTKASGDFGADLVATDRDGCRWVFQCKHYTGKISSRAVQEICAAKAHYRADRAGVMTSSELTAPAKRLAEENDVMVFEHLLNNE